MKSVVICGSKKYASEISKFAADLEKQGILVFEPNFKMPIPENVEFESKNIKHIVFKGLTLEHFDWIRKADVCYIYNHENYAGVSVTLEMGYAAALGKPIIALNPSTNEPARDSLIDKVAGSPKELLKFLN